MRVATAKRALFEIRDEWLTRPLDQEHVGVLFAVLSEGGELPPLSVVKLESGALAVVDGNHRFAAYVKAKSKELPFRIVGTGETSIAWWLAAANRDHGKNRTAEEKRVAVQRALEAPEGADMSNADIARHCGVSVDLIRSVREAVRGAPSAAAERKQILEGRRDSAPDSPRVPKRTAARASANRGRPRLAPDTTDPPQATGDRAPPEALVVGGEADTPSRAELTDDAPLPFEPEAAPEWQGLAAACDRVADAIVGVKRQHSAALKNIPGGQEIAEHLTRAHGIATRRKPRACPVPGCAGDGCPVCGGKRYTLGSVDGWERIVASARRAHG